MNASRFETLSGTVEIDFVEYRNPPDEPMSLLRRWLDVAALHGVREPRALALATADSAGRASNRIVAFTEMTDDGLIFCSHSCSQKGREIAATGWASGVLYWRETGQQVILSGRVTRLPDTVSDKLWDTRPVPLHAMSTASRQSEPITDELALRAAAERLAALGIPLPRPPRFVGYRLEPTAVEFWSAQRDRLHQRLRYDRVAAASPDGGRWTTCRLQP